MSDVIFYMQLAGSILVLLFLLTLLKRRVVVEEVEDENEVVRRPVGPRLEGGAQVRRVGGRVVRSRLHRARQQQQQHREEEENELEELEEDEAEAQEEEYETSNTILDAKIGAKKRKKLEMKAERRAQREQELQEREERQQRQTLLEAQRKEEEEKQRLEEEKQKEEEKRLKEEKERKEYEEYLKLKESFQIESEGFDQEITEKEGQNLYQEFVNYLKNEKVVLLENLASHFKLKAQDAIDRLNTMLTSGDITGVIDDRGKFIYISKDELAAVAKFIQQRGRVSISELVESSNTLVNMDPNQNKECVS